MTQMVKNLPASAADSGDTGLIPSQEDALEEETATHSSILAWAIPWTEEPGGPQSMRLQRVGDMTEQLNSNICKELSSGHSGPCEVASYAELVPGFLKDCTAPFLFRAPAGFRTSTGHFQGHVQLHLTSPKGLSPGLPRAGFHEPNTGDQPMQG